ncbi:MAG: 3D domain-containing protein [Acidobacteriaceae bacterium]|jgi:3D (Asp-Asp-Asp) domain-containing protein|nr:3D domain-containing protein [Acidobacteriaceae bacterium]
MAVLTRSFKRKLAVTAIAALGFVWLYEVTIPDSRFSMIPLGFERMVDAESPPVAGGRFLFSATAYCKGLVTSSGVAVQSGIMAADPALLPVGSVVRLDIGDEKYDGIYTVLDTGPAVQGRGVDVYMWSCNEALQFGRRQAQLTILRLGWNPRATTSSFVDRLLKRPEPSKAIPARPLPIIEVPALAPKSFQPDQP